MVQSHFYWKGPGLLLILKVVQLDSSGNNVHGGGHLESQVFNLTILIWIWQLLMGKNWLGWQDLSSAAMCCRQNPVLIWVSQNQIVCFPQTKIWMAFLSIFILKGDSQPMIEPPQKWVSPMAPTERRDTWGERRSYLERELLPGIWTLTWNLNSHLEGELSIVGNLASNNPSLTSLKSQWQSWNRFQLLEKVSKYLSSEKWESDLCSQGRATESK